MINSRLCTNSPIQYTWLIILVAAWILTPVSSYAQNIEVLGGPDQSGHNYTWTIKNHSDIPITEVIIPHFRGDLFGPVPHGWEHEATEIPGKTSTGKAGTCHYRSTNRGIYSVGKGEEIQFHMRIAPKGAPKGLGVVTIIFQDGSKMEINNVPVSVPEAWLSQNAPFLGMAVCFIIFVVVMSRKSNTRKKTDIQEQSSQ